MSAHLLGRDAPLAAIFSNVGMDTVSTRPMVSPASTVSVAPNSRALSSRNLFESIAMTREAPHRPVVRMAASADARQRYNDVIGDSPV